MEVIISKVCGLCAGCRFAYETAINENKKGNLVTVFKEIVHNKTVNKNLMNFGIKLENNINNLTSNETVIIRAHGEPRTSYEFFDKNKIKYVDCTCFNVKKIHNAVDYCSKNGYKIIIIGKYKNSGKGMHPEVFGTIGWCNNSEILIEDEQDLDKFKGVVKDRLYLVCQTTFNIKKAEFLISKIEEICKLQNNELIVNNSICSAQKIINECALELAKRVDLMVVVGGKNSSNTIELYNNVKDVVKTVFIENIEEWQIIFEDENINLSNLGKIGLTSGASTLKEELQQLKSYIEKSL